ncbi:hypothetical protein M0M57_11700 [Flavobacterium azooxidireducens]|uniref:Uncharacterized protein n=1 Tax=Flavobacterium azooxidireducens TaxID=1871076 RepID=A0ABY4KBX1_9FLAO|nr:hypothetical protein [Flavobacterium azooxidireducens]UPQ78282.1 hypothetical protein M0M57_11700 [Flavobacterium azooxidireducens]
MEINKNSGGEIKLKEAQDLIAAFQSIFPEEKKAFFIGSNHVEAILAQDRCIGVRIYNAYDEDKLTKTVVLVGVDTLGNDMKEGVIVDRTVICPPHCPTISILD